MRISIDLMELHFKMGKMGQILHKYVQQNFPKLPLAPYPESWKNALGKYDNVIKELIEKSQV